MSNLHNALKEATHISNAIRRMFGGDSELSVERLSETLQPVVNIWEHPFCAYLRGEVLWGGAIFAAATPAENTMVGIVNPVGSKILTTIESLHIGRASTAGWGAVRAGLASVIQATLATTITEAARDRRSAAPRTVVVAGSDADITIGAAAGDIPYLEYIRLEQNDFLPSEAVPIVLPPGKGIYVFHETQNVSFYLKAYGSERPAVSGELGP